MVPYRFQELVRVVGIGQSQEHNGQTVALLSLEVYKDGCLLLVLLQSYPKTERRGGSLLEPVNFPVTASDDRGNQYHVTQGNGEGSGVQGGTRALAMGANA